MSEQFAKLDRFRYYRQTLHADGVPLTVYPGSEIPFET
jgi:hypothetical protein